MMIVNFNKIKRIIILLIVTCFLSSNNLAHTAENKDINELLNDNIQFSITDASMYEVVKLLRRTEGIPISFIEAPVTNESITVDYNDKSLKSILNQLTSDYPYYKLDVINNRLTLYYNLPKYHKIVSDIEIDNRPTYIASETFIQELRKNYNEFNNLSVPLFGISYATPAKGVVSRSSLFDKVSIHGDLTVLEHFTQLLSDYEKRFFTVNYIEDRDEFTFMVRDVDNYIKNFLIPKKPDRDPLEETVSIELKDAQVLELVEQLRTKFNIPISFIEGNADSKINIIKHEVKLKEVLEELVNQHPNYKFRILYNRLLLYDSKPEFHLVLTYKEFGKSRTSLIHEVINQAISKYPETTILNKFQIDKSTPDKILQNYVSLNDEGTLIEYLVQILGGSKNLVFTIYKDKKGEYLLSYERLK